MKALRYMGPDNIVYGDVDIPKRNPGYAKIKLIYCGICGGDMGIYAGKHPRAKPPLIPGHEFLGIIEETDGEKGFKKGDRVIPFPLMSCGSCVSCRNGIPHICQTLRLLGIDADGGMAEYAVVDESVLVKVPEELSNEQAALIEPLAVAVRAVHQSGYSFLDTAVVMGAGPIGILTAIALKMAGASLIIVSDIAAKKLEICRELGFETVNIEIADLEKYVVERTNNDGADIVFECSGTGSATFQATRLAKMEGTVCMTGIHKKPDAFNLPEFSFKEQRLVATRCYTREEFNRAAVFAVQIKDKMSKLVSHIVPMKDGAEAFRLVSGSGRDTIKVLIDCQK